MRILLVNSSSGLGGAETHVVQLSRGFIARGHEVHVASPGEGPLVAAVSAAGASHHPIPMYPERPSVGQVLRLRNVVRRSCPDVVHLHGLRAGLIGRLTRVTLGRVNMSMPFVYTVHGAHYLHYRPLFANAYMKVERLLSPLADQTIFVCRDDLVSSARNGAVSRRAGVVVHNGLAVAASATDLTAEHHSARGTASARAQLGLPRDRPIVLAVGRLHRQKDYPTLLRAVAELRRHIGVSSLVLIVGDGPERARLHALAKNLRLGEDYVRFLGPRNDVPKLLAASDAFVMSSLWEGLPYVLLEAMAAGLPVAATDVGGTREVVRHRVTGLVVPPSRPTALASAIATLLLHPDISASWGRAGRLRVLRHFTENLMVEHVLAVYRSVCA